MSVITNSLAMMDTSSAVTSLDADAVVYDNTTSGLTATDAQAAIDELSGEINSLDATDIAFTAPSTSGHSTYGANTDTVQEALNDINDAMRSVIEYGDNSYYVKEISALSVTYNACGGFWSGTSVSDVETGLNHIGEYLNNLSPGASAASDVSFDNFLDSIYSSNTDNVQEALTDINTVIKNLVTGDIYLPNTSKTGIYANADNVQDALDAIKTALDSGGGGSVDASDVTFDIEKGCWGGSCAGSVEEALFDLDNRIEALSGGGGGSSTDASDVTFDYNKGGCWGGSSAEDVETALFDLDERVRDLKADDIAYTSACAGLDVDMDIFEYVTNVDAALSAVESFANDIANPSGNIKSTKVAYTKPQNSIYSSGTDTVAEALDDVSTVIQALDSTDIAIPAASKTGIYANTATVQAALDAIKTAIAGGGGGSSSASSVSFTKPQGGIYSSGTDTVQEALEDVSAKIIYLEASDIGFLGSGCSGGYPTDVGTVQDALNALEHLLYKYSEYEAETGLLWFNDKPIYQISVEPESNVTNLFDTNELEIDDLVYMEATLTNSGGTKRWTISGSSSDFYWDTATHMIVYGGSDVVTTATIRYTKTSD